jgi:hypothetical protein
MTGMSKKRESRYVKVARIANGLTQQALPRYSPPKSPHPFTLPQLAACVLMTFYLDVSYRDMEEFLLASEAVCQVLDWPRVPDHSTLSRTDKKLGMIDFETLKDTLRRELAVAEAVIASDSTGFSPSQASAYYQTRSGRRFRDFLKGASAVGTQTQFILAWRTGRGPGNDASFLSGLRRDAWRHGRYVGKRRAWVMLAAAGFDGQTLQAGDVIPPIRRGGNLIDPARNARRGLGLGSAPGWRAGAALENRNRQLGHQTPGRRRYSLPSAQPAKPPADYPGPGL